ncbi:MAG: hypothetical protein QF492_03045 [Candidatus Krumholzibacteria bacterium]|jgi:hypothetical protein|nr:hypothetical protein [Candidatus Krumholzibacteria bacterium]MDP6668875.1 hypothetical protein [Candidatus Krumholzibacteria bacterium]MDP6797014.1 hypothetical protein [Candidatus Krumholzibacteria bacterium]MDP7022219.1 hypothetical protein [Candidatus Krumholzibacteria bacterium]
MIGLKAFIFIFLTMPLGHAMMIGLNATGRSGMIAGAVFMALLGLALLIWTRYLKSSTTQSLLGALAGIFLWTGAVEYGLKFGAEALGIPVENGTLGEYRIMKHTWSFIVLVSIYLLFQESVRCNFFVWLRQKLGLMRGKAVEGKVSNYGPRTAFEMITLLWFFYVLLLIAYDETLFGVKSLFTYSIFLGSFAATGYLLVKLVRIRDMGYAIRYAIPTVIILWNNVEILAKWNVFTEPWITMDPAIMSIIGVAFVLASFTVYNALRAKEIKS